MIKDRPLEWKIAILDKQTEESRRIIRSHLPLGFILRIAETGEIEERLRIIKDADFIITGTTLVSKELIYMAPKLKLIQKWGIGYDKIDINTARQLGIGVAIACGSNAIPVAELTLNLMQSVCRNIVYVDKNMREGRWLKSEIRDHSFMLNGKKIGLIGFGFIGKAVAKLLKGFSVEINYFDLKRSTTKEEKELKVNFINLDEIISNSDIISLHIPLNDSTHYLINKKNLQKMKPSVILINTARGGLIKEKDLVWALENKIISGAGLDVYEVEPPSPNNPLFRLNNVILTCHLGSAVIDNVSNMARHVFGNIKKIANGQNLLDRDIIVPPSI